MLTYLLVNLIGGILIILVLWWFWLGKTSSQKAVTAKQHSVIDIKVADGVYEPAMIQTKVGNKIVLRFTRYEENPCAEAVIFADFNQSANLPIGEAILVELTPHKAGEFEFTCQMGMYRGKLIVRP